MVKQFILVWIMANRGGIENESRRSELGQKLLEANRRNSPALVQIRGGHLREMFVFVLLADTSMLDSIILRAYHNILSKSKLRHEGQ